ncbi:energy transducer TonB [Plebeiibacterium sediminum]|uniref:Energy transducer TonB n=1 Tax=Plebeiibacterium sediminum TaxID=2992112 RepID=A0AAE3SGL0_9BACT|nr:energy transducer TonB [Plebeiobacterium sediminum]MCW3788446.1 energy transducer TonB [Plebeiobacterium sediminum]
MKRVLLFTVLIVFSLISMAQVYNYEEVIVRAPKYSGPVYGVENTKDMINPISKFLYQDLSNKVQAEYTEFQEGTVVIDFTVNEDGSLENFIVRNSVSYTNDNEVIESIKSTSGKWIPGSKDGVPVQMEKRVVIAFSDENSPALEEQAIYYSTKGIRKFYKAEQCESDPFLSDEVRLKRSDRKYHTALNRFNKAESLRPEEAQIIFWQAKTYEKLGDDLMRDLKLLDFDELVESAKYVTTEVINVYI